MSVSELILEDVQSREDHRQIAIDKVGISQYKYPITLVDKKNERQQTIATLSMSVSLPETSKGTHMSRFLEIINAYDGTMSALTLPALLQEIREKLNAERSFINMSFSYFIEKQAPVSNKKGLMDFDCTLTGESTKDLDDVVFGVQVPVTTLCPCSKEISDYGAHNQRGIVTLQVRGTKQSGGSFNTIWFEELIGIVESVASAPLYPILKRTDERHVTMQAYDNPAFVEDLIRNVAQKLQEDERIQWFRLICENQESIHKHNAYAELVWSRKKV